MIMKRCPNPECDFKTADNEMKFCPKCSNKNGNGLVRLQSVSSSENPERQSSDSREKDKMMETDYNSKRIAEIVDAAMSSSDNPIVNGDANAISGGIHVEKTDSSQKTVNIQIKELSEAEKLHKNRLSFHDACVGFVDNGHISDEDNRQLNAIRESLGLHRDIADFIIKDVLKQSIRKRVGLPGSAQTIIDIAKQTIEINDLSSIQNSLGELSALRATVDNDQLDQIYFQLKAILTPGKYIDDYRTIHEKSYWEVFWCHVAMIRTEPEKAGESIAELVQWDSHYPYQDQAIIQTIGYLMQDRELEARVAYRYIAPGFSTELGPVHFAISELLDRDWDEITDVSPRSKFYIDSLFRKAYDRIRAEAEERKKVIIDIFNKGIQEAKEIQHRKEDFLQKYEAKNGSVSDALLLSGVTQPQFDEWKRSDVDFNLSLEAVNKRIAEKRDKEERLIEEQKSAFLAHYESDKGSIKDALEHSGVEQSQVDKWKGVDPSFRERIADIDARLAKEREEEERRVKVQKERFISTYRTYNCDMQKTCSEVGLSPTIISNWRKSDAAFDNSLNCMERDRRKSIIFKKVIPCIVIAILLAVIYVVGRPLVIRRIEQNTSKREAQAIEKTRQKEIQEGYIILLNDYSLALSQVDRDSMTIDSFNDSLLRIEQILSEIKRIEVSNPTIVESQHSTLLGKALSLCKELHSYFRGKATSAMSTDELEVWIKKNEIVDSVEQRLNLANNSL